MLEVLHLDLQQAKWKVALEAFLRSKKLLLLKTIEQVLATQFKAIILKQTLIFHPMRNIQQVRIQEMEQLIFNG